MGKPEADYTDDQGEMDGIGHRPLPDFLPPPERLILAEDTVKVTLALSRESVNFFKRQAGRQGVSYQLMIRALVDAYAKRHA